MEEAAARGWFHPPHTIAYTWTENVPAGRIVASPHFKQLRYISIGKGLPPVKERSKWITIERDLLADYRRAFPGQTGKVPALKGILLKCDANNTRTRASSRVKAVALIAAKKTDKDR